MKDFSEERIAQMCQVNRKLLRQVQRWQKAWDSLQKQLASDSPEPGDLKLHLTQLAGWPKTFPDRQEDWVQLVSAVEQEFRRMVRHLETTLSNLCKKVGYEIEGQFPSLRVDGLIKVEIDDERNKARVNNKTTQSLSANSIMDRIVEEHKRLWERAFDPTDFLKKMQMAYLAVCTKRVTPEGEYVPLLDVHQEMILLVQDGKFLARPVKTTFLEYPRDLFAADLSRLLESNIVMAERGFQLEIAPVRDSRKAVYTYNRDTKRGRYFGLVRFRRELQ